MEALTRLKAALADPNRTIEVSGVTVADLLAVVDLCERQAAILEDLSDYTEDTGDCVVCDLPVAHGCSSTCFGREVRRVAAEGRPAPVSRTN
jgi:hypothetical protein